MTREYGTVGVLEASLFEQLDRLNDPDLSGEALKQEISRAKAVSAVADKIIEVGKLEVEALRFKDTALDANAALPRMLCAGE